MLGSKQLLRTNTALTANFKLVVSSGYKLYLESYDSNTELSDQKYKHFPVNETSYMTERVPAFFKGLPNDLVFGVRKHTASDTVQTDYNMQMDDAYWSGAGPVEDKWHKEEYEYHAPLWVDPANMPKHFVVLRVDGPGAYNLQPIAGSSADPTKKDFYKEIVKKWKCVSLFDMTKATTLGKFLDKNFVSNEYWPREPFELNLRKTQFSRWYGYDIRTGGIGIKSTFIQDLFAQETTHFEMEDYITSGFRKNGVAMPHVLNMKFLFDDTPGVINSKGTARRKWSINRYMGFYLDNLELVRTVSPYTVEPMRNTAYIIDNVFTSSPTAQFVQNNTELLSTSSSKVEPANADGAVRQVGNSSPAANESIGKRDQNVSALLNFSQPRSADPTVNGWPGNTDILYIKRGDTFLMVKRTEQFSRTTYHVIDNQLNNGSVNDLNPSPAIVIVYEVESIGFPNGKMIIKHADGSPLVIENFDEYDLHVIEIGGVMHTLQKDGTHYVINTDTRMETRTNELVQELAGKKIASISYDAPDEVAGPITFKIYRAQFSEQSDLDFDRLDTGYANYEYDEQDKVPNTGEPKLWVLDKRDAEASSVYVESDYLIDSSTTGRRASDTSKFYIPASSEYAAGEDLWVLRNNETLTSIWDKNQSVNKWGFMGSVSHADYPYKLNNSSAVSGAFNRAPSPLDPHPDRTSCNLDWFYTIGEPRTRDNSIVKTPNFPAHWVPYKPCAHRSLEIDMAAPVALAAEEWNPILPDGVTPGSLQDKYPDGRPFWQHQFFDLHAYENPKLPFDYFDMFFTQQQTLNAGAFDTTYFIKNNTSKFATFNKSDEVNGPVALFRGISASVFWSRPAMPDQLTNIKLDPSAELAGYKFSAVLTKRPTTDTVLHGMSGITVYVNKVYRNVLVAVWVYTPHSSMTNFESIERDQLYKSGKLYYDLNSLTEQKAASITPSELTLLNVINAINDPSQKWGFSRPAEFLIVEEKLNHRIISGVLLFGKSGRATRELPNCAGRASRSTPAQGS